MNDYGYFHSPRDGMSVHHRATPSMTRSSSVSVERGNVRVKCLPKEHNAMSWTGLEMGPLDLETSALTTAPPNWINRRKSMVYSLTKIYLQDSHSCRNLLSMNNFFCDLNKNWVTGDDSRCITAMETKKFLKTASVAPSTGHIDKRICHSVRKQQGHCYCVFQSEVFKGRLLS